MGRYTEREGLANSLPILVSLSKPSCFFHVSRLFVSVSPTRRFPPQSQEKRARGQMIGRGGMGMGMQANGGLAISPPSARYHSSTRPTWMGVKYGLVEHIRPPCDHHVLVYSSTNRCLCMTCVAFRWWGVFFFQLKRPAGVFNGEGSTQHQWSRQKGASTRSRLHYSRQACVLHT